MVRKFENLPQGRPRQKQFRNLYRRLVSILTKTNVSMAQTAVANISAKGVGALSFLSNVPSVSHLVITAKFPFNLEFWKENFKKSDPIFIQTILDGILYHVKIGYDGPQMSLESDNQSSSLEHYDKVSKIIRKNIECGHVTQSFPSPS